MRISTEWLNEYVATPPDAELEHVFEMAGIGVENHENGVWTLEITSNRGDWLSAQGLAREISAMTGASLKTTQPDIVATGFESGEATSAAIRVEIEDADDCAHYVARIIEGVQIGPSPDWMQKRLVECGMRPINNVVDVTNYVMLETGQPLHAFDADTLRGDTIIVRRAQSGEKLVTLDETERELDDEVLLITDESGPIGIAGIMGGHNSEVTERTTRIFLESAHFSPTRTRRGARALNLRTEASRRFERWVDPNSVLRCADRAARLLAECCGGRIAPGVTDVCSRIVDPALVTLRFARCRAILGLDLSEDEVVSALQRLGFEVEPAEESATVSIPTWRRDIEREIDLIEEVARIHGYDKIPTTLPKNSVPGAGLNAAQRLQQAARATLLGCGLNEIVTYSLENSAATQRAGLTQEAPAVTLRNPLTEDYTQLRTSLIPSLLNVLSNNARTRAGIFEIGKVFASKHELQPDEPLKIGIALLDAPVEPHWRKETPTADFFALKAVVETLLSALGAPGGDYRPALHPSLHPGRCAEIVLDGETLGIIGEVHPDVRENYNLKSRAVLAQLDWAILANHAQPSRTAQTVSRFPASDRDLALVLNYEVPAARVEKAAREAAGALLESVRVFDVYTGSPIPEGQKSLAISLRFRAKERTLTDAEVDEAMTKVRAATESTLGAQVRS